MFDRQFFAEGTGKASDTLLTVVTRVWFVLPALQEKPAGVVNQSEQETKKLPIENPLVPNVYIDPLVLGYNYPA